MRRMIAMAVGVMVSATVAMAQPEPTTRGRGPTTGRGPATGRGAANLPPAAPMPTAEVAGGIVGSNTYPTNMATINTDRAGVLKLRAIDIPRYTQTGPFPDPLPTRPTVIAPVPKNPNLPTIWTIGDSTVRCGYNGTGDDRPGQWGWGTPFVGYFDPSKANAVNRAVGGTTSGSFYNVQWKTMIDLVKKGDVVIMQFGTNAGGVELGGIGEETREIAARGGGQPQVGHTYGWFIRQFIAETRAKGATPVVCSLIMRNQRTPEGLVRHHSSAQATWARDVAAAEKADFIELNELIARKYDPMEKPQVDALFSDGTHTTWPGAVLNAEVVISGLKRLKTDPCAQYYLPAVSQIAAAPEVVLPAN